MRLLEEKILKDGLILEGDILKVDNFLNHQMDTVLLDEMGRELKELFKDKKINKILTIESSGIGIAVMASKYFDNCPVVFAKKGKSANVGGEVYACLEKSYTRNVEYNVSWNLLPLQDAIDMAVFLIKTTETMQKFSCGIIGENTEIPAVGGPIDVAVITKNDGIKWINRKEPYFPDE